MVFMHMLKKIQINSLSCPILVAKLDLKNLQYKRWKKNLVYANQVRLFMP